MFIGLMATTHLVLAIAGCCFFLGDSSWLMIGLAAVGSQIPDLDTTHSAIGRTLYPLAAWIEKRYAHRTVTHSIALTMMLGAIAAIPWIILGYSWKYWAVIPLAHALSCFGDTLTKTGVALFWPNPARVVFLRNPHRRIETGTPTEYLLLVVLMAIALLALDINTNGGLWLSITRSFGNANSVEAVMNSDGASNHLWVKIQGVKAGDRTPIDQRFFLIAQSTPQQFIIADESGIYETGSEIIANRLTVEKGAAATVREQAIALNDEALLNPLIELYNANPGAAIFLTGSLVIDAPEEVEAIATPGQLHTITKNGNSLTLKYCPIERIGKEADDQWATGQIMARIITPAPF